MADITIDVRGSHTVTVPPERATVHASVAADGPSPEPVFEAVSRAAATVRASVEPLLDRDHGPVTAFTLDQVRTSRERPWNQQGKPLPFVHRAAATLTVTFCAVDDLASWIAQGSGIPELHVGHIEWDLTPARRAGVERDARSRALEDARIRAQDYADALGLGPVQVRRVADPGVRPMFKARAFAVAADEAAAPELELMPEDLQITVEVEATFTVGA